MSSYPVVRLPLTFAWGLLGACHRDGSLAVLWLLRLERLENLPEDVLSLLKNLKWLHHLSGLWSPLLCCKQIDNCHKTSAAWPYFPIRAEEILLAWQADNYRGICDLSKKPTLYASRQLLCGKRRVAIVNTFWPSVLLCLLNSCCYTGPLAHSVPTQVATLFVVWGPLYLIFMCWNNIGLQLCCNLFQ